MPHCISYTFFDGKPFHYMMRLLKKLLTNFSFRIYLLYFLIVGGAAWFIASRSLQTVEVSVSQAAEEILVDTANLLAELAGQESNAQKINIQRFETLMPKYLARRFNAPIYQLTKKQPDLQVYITDKKGKVLYDSTGQSVGKDFSRWRDVSHTLKGEYGARSSPLNHTVKSTTNEDEKGLFVAAPIKHNKKIIGVLTVVKGKTPLGDYVTLSTKKITAYAFAAFFIALVMGTFTTWWLWRSINKLSRYAKQLGQGKHVPQPRIIHSDFKPLANAVESMYKDLEGKEYVENYTHTMAHELKSPLTGIIATTELLQQNLSPADRQQFVNNIHDSAQRMTDLIERLLELAAVENKNQLEHTQTIHLSQLVKQVIASREVLLEKKQLQIHLQTDNQLTIQGEPTLLSQSLANLLDNAIEFSNEKGSIKISVEKISDEKQKNTCKISLHDSGNGIADFAKARLFERFFSTPRPHNQQRSSGLGLAFVKEVVQLHGGSVTLDNHPDGGAIATIYL